MEKQIVMLHTRECMDNKFDTRVEGTTQPWLGENLYALNRVEPVVPWKPLDTANQIIEEPQAPKS